MADSNMTKQALSKALKELMLEQSFEKIRVADICEKCNMNRKSFYYHFKDKYDLANWIFDTEFMELAEEHSLDVLNAPHSFEEHWHSLVVVCEYFYENRGFYRKIMKVEGENSFSAHFRQFLFPIMEKRVEDLVGQEEISKMALDFIVDGLLCAIGHWLLDKNCVTAEEFVGSMLKLTNLLILGIIRKIEDEPNWLDAIQEIQ